MCMCEATGPAGCVKVMSESLCVFGFCCRLLLLLLLPDLTPLPEFPHTGFCGKVVLQRNCALVPACVCVCVSVCERERE